MVIKNQQIKRFRVMYVTSLFKEYVEWFTTEEEANAFTAKLDERIKRGTCLGYDMMKI